MEASQPTDPRGGRPADFDWASALADGEAQARDLIRSHPVTAVLAAAALGFVIARLVRDAE